MADLRVVAGLDIDAREAKKAARKLCATWRRALKTHVSEGRSPKLLRGDVLLADELTNFPSADFGYCYIGQKNLAGRLGASRRTAQRAMARLKAAGFLICARGGQGRTSRWSFSINSNPLFSVENDASRCDTDDAARSVKMAPQEASPVTPQDATRMAHNPYITEPVEQSRLEREPSSTPAPPPSLLPRAREARSVADEVLGALTQAQRKSHRWKGLARWIAAKLEQGWEAIDVSTGILQALDTLKGSTPSTFAYFDRPIERARASRLAPLPEPRTAQTRQAATVSEARLIAYLAERLDTGTTAITALGADWLAEQHRQFVSRTIGMPEIVLAARERLKVVTHVTPPCERST